MMPARHRQRLLRSAICACLVAAAPALLAGPPTSTSIHVEQPWIRWLPAHLPMAGYAKLANAGNRTAHLTRASSPDFGSVELMRSEHRDGSDEMTDVAEIAIPAHGHAALQPGGYHVMLGHAKRPIKPGDKVPLVLHFANGKTVQVDFPVLPASATGPSDASG